MLPSSLGSSKHRMRMMCAAVASFLFALTLCMMPSTRAYAAIPSTVVQNQNAQQATVPEGMATYVVTLKQAAPGVASGQTPDQYIASLQQHAQRTQADLKAFLDSKQTAGAVHSYTSFYIINSISVVTTSDVADQLRARQDVAQVIVSGEVHTQKPVDGKTTKPSLRSHFSLFDMFNAQAYVPWNLKTIMADRAQQEGMDGAGVVVGIIDSGVDATHPAIKHAWRGNTPGMEATSWFDATNPSDRSSLPTDATGHGTHVAGTILGTDPQNKSLLGVAPKAQWIAAKVFDADGETTLDRLIAAGEWMMAPTDEKGTTHPELRPQIINSSWGGKSENEFYRDILKKWRAVGILPVFSAGNTSSSNAGGEGSIGTPASYPEAFAVGALRKDNKIAQFSLRGPSAYEGDIKPDVSAPGVNILSSIPNNLYALRSGTSMASPHVAGVAALVYQANPQLTPDQVEQIITSTATPLNDAENVAKPNHAYGHGKVNAYNAVKAAQKTKNNPSADVTKNGFATLNGKILAPGQDESAPTIKHSTLKSMFNSANFDVQAQVSDDNGVQSVTLYLAKQGSNQYTEHVMKLIKGTKKEGVYSVTLKPSDLAATGATMNYYIVAVDVTNKSSNTTAASCVVKDGIGIGYKNDFEEEVDGFEFGGKTPLWEWGIPQSGPKAAASGSKLVATKLDGTYKGLKDALLITPVIDLSKESRSAVLNFKHWYDLGVGDYAFNDTAEVWVGELQNEGTDAEKYNYKNVQLYKYSSHDKWKDEYIDLSAYKCKKIVVMFALRHGGGFSERTEAGWYIDDLAIEAASNELPATPASNVDIKVRNNYRVSYEFDPLDNPKITQYNLYRSSSPTGDFVKVSSIDKRTAGTYTAKLFDEPVPQEGTYYYCATAQIGERESAKSEVKSVTFTKGTKVLSYTFEKGNEGWTSPADAKGAAWTHGTPDSPNPFPDSKVGSMPSPDQAKGKNPNSPRVWATELNTFRKAKATYTLVSPTMDLSKLTSARVYMQMWYNTTGRKGADEWSVYDDDRGKILISANNGESWEDLFSLDDTTVEGKNINGRARLKSFWFLDGFDIPQKYLTSTFKMKFELSTGSELDGPTAGGWYIDDVSIFDTAAKNKITPHATAATQDAGDDVSSAPAAPEAAHETHTALALTSTSGTFAPTQKPLVPVEGTVTLKELGMKVASEPGSGWYSLRAPAGTYTAVVEANGYSTKEVPVTLTEDTTTVQDVVLSDVKLASVSLTVTDSSNKPIPTAQVKLYRDHVGDASYAATVAQSTTIEKVYPGSYSVVVSARGYQTATQTITVAEGQKLQLEPIKLALLDTSGDNAQTRTLSYDDGTAESYLTDVKDGKSLGVLVSNNQPLEIKSVRMYLAPQDTAAPNTQKFKVSIYDKNQPDGYPGKVLFGPYEVTAQPTQGWNEVVLPESVQVSGDFVIAYTQVGDEKHGPRMCVDETTPGLGHSYRMSNGAWYDPDEKGSYMMRAVVAPVVALPVPDNKPAPDTPPAPDNPSTPDTPLNPDVQQPSGTGNGGAVEKPNGTVEGNQTAQSGVTGLHKKASTALPNTADSHSRQAMLGVALVAALALGSAFAIRKGLYKQK